MRVFRIKHKPTGKYVVKKIAKHLHPLLDNKGTLYFTTPTVAVMQIKNLLLDGKKIPVNDGDLQIIELKKL